MSAFLLGAEHMTWQWGRGPAMALTGLTLLAALACSSSDPIEPNNGNLTLTLGVSPAYSSPLYQRARFQIDQVTVRPFDPLANGYLGIPLGLLQSPTKGSLRTSGSTTLATVPLKSGAYRVETIRISQLELSTEDQDFAQTVRCSGSDLLGARITGITLLQFASPPVIQVPQGAPAPLVLTVDAPGLVNLIVDLADCSQQTVGTPTSSQLAPFITVN